MDNYNVISYTTEDMYLETSTTSLVSKGLGIAFASECLDILYDLRWMMLLGLILIISDFWFGINAAKVKKIEIRKSRAGRRTLNKIIDYTCYLLLGAVLGKAIGEPYGLEPITISASVLILCYGFEIDSIYGHICALHGIQKNYSIWRILWSIFTLKFKSLGEAFKEMSEQSKEYKQNKQNNHEDVL